MIVALMKQTTEINSLLESHQVAVPVLERY